MITTRIIRANKVCHRGLLYCATRSCSGSIQENLSSGKGSSTTDTASTPPRIINSVELREKDVSRVYCVSREEVRSVFPHRLSSKFASMVDSLGRGCWVLRRQSYEIMKALREFSPGVTQNARFLLYGSDGCGKSLCLSQVVHWAVKSGWTVVHVPSVFSWTHSKEEVRSSAKHPGTHDQPKEAVTWLKNFRSLNSKCLAQMQLSRDYSWTKREKSEAGDSLMKVIEQGLLRPAVATDVVGVVLEEVAMEAKNSKTLLAVDEFNGCFNPTSIKLGKHKWVEPGQLNLIKYLTSTISPDSFPGGVVLALSRTKMYRHHVPSCKPEDLLGQEGMEVVKDIAVVEVPHFDREEMDNCLTYYSHEKWLNKALTPETTGELWCLSSGNPAELHRLCTAL